MIVGIIPAKMESVLILRTITDVSVNLIMVEKIAINNIVRLITMLITQDGDLIV